MSTNSPLPPKQDLPKEIWKVATTLSEDAQNAATRKARELGFDINKGRIPLEETLLNLSHNRDILLDAADKNKLQQLPLKLQYNLLAQTQKISESLTALTNGTDTLLALEDSVDDLMSLVWQYNLHNLSREVLGFQNKMNQLKAQETLIRRAHQEAEDFEASNKRAQELLVKIEEASKVASDLSKSSQSALDQLSATLVKAQEQEQRVAALTIQSQQHDTTSAQYAANAKTASADVEALANKTRATQGEIDLTKTELMDLVVKAQGLLASTEKAMSEKHAEFQSKFDQVRVDQETEIKALRENIVGSLQELQIATQGKIDAGVAASEKRSKELEEEVRKVATETNDWISKAELDLETRVSSQISDFTQNATKLTTEIQADHQAKLAEIGEKSDRAISTNDAEFKRLSSNLNELEGRIRESIERATGFTLFHSFQKRQLDLAKSKKFWGIALACAVAISLCASAAFIYSLRYVQVYNAAFYLKLSISLPIIYAIAFCSVQYARERRLEEEYAFKSSISISLDPYQKLVAQLVDKDKPEELAKYTAFVIDSVTRVFTSPTEQIFDDHSANNSSAEKLIKSLSDFLQPLLKALNK
jgi:hypothetical protein